MRKIISYILAAVLLLAFAGCGGGSTATAKDGTYTPGTYTATASGMGTVTVTATVDASGITEVVLDLSGETESIGQVAGDTLKQQILDTQSEAIDGVTGATVTSSAVKSALGDCLKQARGDTSIATAKMAPGSYSAEAYGFNIGWTDKVAVTVSDNAILSIAYGDDCGDTPPMLDTVEKRLFPRIIEAQSVGVDAVTGATATSSAVKAAVKACLIQALAAGGSDESAIAKFSAVPEKNGGNETLNTQVLVIGMGGSGTYVGLRAEEEGADVLTIEKQGHYGGTTALTSEIMSINPNRIKAAYNNGKDFCDEDAMYKAWLAYVDGDAKVDMIDLFFANSGDALDWLALDHDILFDFDPKVGFTPADVYKVKFQWYPNTNPDVPGVFGANKAEIAADFDKLVSDFTALGGKYMLETEAYELIYDGNGRVTGAKAKNLIDGTVYTINADAVVLATGGFLGSSEMTQKYLSDNYYPLKGAWNMYGSYGNDGKMIEHAIEKGAATYNIGMPPEVHMSGSAKFIPASYGYEIHEIEGAIGRFSGVQRVWSVADLPMYLGISGNSLAVGKDGKRFTAETGVAMLDPWIAGPNYYSIWSTDQINDIRDNGFSYDMDGVAAAFLGYLGAIPQGTPLPEAYDVLDTAIKLGYVYKADTIEELAKKIGVDPAALTATVGTYNGYCTAGKDKDFGKAPDYLEAIGDGPYYAVKMASYSYCTCAALDVNSDLQVLDTNGKPIGGLFAVGGDSMGVLFSDRKPYVTFGGANNGWALTSAYICGKTVADYVESK
ncbi:FAD-binding protein [Sediminispirochaeta bajacaliforniensis]|uniref:FAD-binding protein n=1 Tax=Sediminispirochaeta bajacaliforniensis TaxID=148 RepID=UPI0003622011|nr:FAD-binding protein [Sediminispirochaeta bajacaliforniensis]